jgi:hypothetical protein
MSSLVAIMGGDVAPLLPEGLEVVCDAGLCAVYAPVQRRVFATRRGVVRAAAERQAWLERLMKAGTVLPALPQQDLKPRAAGAMLRGNATRLHGELARLKDKVQLQVSLSLDVAAGIRHFRGRAGPFAGVGDPDGLASVLADLLREAVEVHAADLHALPRAGDIVANLVILIDDRHQDLAEAAIASVDAIWPEGLRFRIVGPSPAVSFASVGVQRLGPADLSAARRLLGVAPGADAAVLSDARARALRASGPACAHSVRGAAAMLLCAHAAGNATGPVHLAHVWSEGMASSAPVPLVEVA